MIIGSMRSAIALAVCAALVAGCAGNDEAAPEPRRATTAESGISFGRCDLIEPGWNVAYALCRNPANPRDRGRFEFRDRRIPIDYPTTAPAGHWSDGFLSRDGKTLLLQWTAECEVPFAFFVPARGGTPRPVLGGARPEDWQPTIAHGWTLDGDAIVEVVPGCGAPRARSKIRLISP